MANFRSEESSFRRASLVSALSVAGVAAAVYALTLANYVFPGDSARLLVQWSGIDALAADPVWTVPVLAAAVFGICALISAVLGKLPVVGKYLV